VTQAPSRCAGHGLIAALALAILLGAGGLLAQGELEAQFRIRAQAHSIAALSQAREALLGYAISYDESHAHQGYGYLPCPDANNTGSTTLGPCGARGLSAIGRLPWRTLSLPDLRDGWGECLWYAVAGSVKHSPKALALNWDSPGQFALASDDGLPLPVASPNGLAAAIIIAPGPPLDSQDRGSSTGPCAGRETALDDVHNFVDAIAAFSPSGISQFRQGHVGSHTRNDLIAWIGVDDVFDALRRRRDFAIYIDTIGVRAAQFLTPRLQDVAFLATHTQATPSGSLLAGELPAANALGITDAGTKAAHDNWRNQFRMAVCADGSACIRFNDTTAPHSSTCRAVLLFGGERIREGAQRQQRNTPAERADIAQYLEGDNPGHFTQGVPEFHGAPEFRIADSNQPASQDVIRCLN